MRLWQISGERESKLSKSREGEWEGNPEVSAD
jgi:hypothetical protein